MSYYTQVHLNLSAGKSYTTAERVLMLYAVNTYSALMIYTMYMYAIYTQQVYSIWEVTNLDEDVEPLSELDVGSLFIQPKSVLRSFTWLTWCSVFWS